eukprot:TRINITY_DN17030_c0_g2_i1.p2 TRINITY_DN17030_c0_g2~~TRINITY_DN17030_c0_g2_i1.p2  ORF type:complete len:207 (+),score=46.94 TRINITY_DN17030_c0_g2_i1:90-710(+)
MCIRDSSEGWIEKEVAVDELRMMGIEPELVRELVEGSLDSESDTERVSSNALANHLETVLGSNSARLKARSSMELHELVGGATDAIRMWRERSSWGGGPRMERQVRDKSSLMAQRRIERVRAGKAWRQWRNVLLAKASQMHGVRVMVRLFARSWVEVSRGVLNEWCWRGKQQRALRAASARQFELSKKNWRYETCLLYTSPSPRDS